MMPEQTTASDVGADPLIMQLLGLRKTVEENTKATIAMSSAIRMIYLVPLALAAMGLAAWLLRDSRISEASFLSLTMVCLTPFFGEGVGRVLERLPLVGKKADSARTAAIVLFLIASLALAL